MAKDAVLSFRIPADLKAALEREATADDRSVSSTVERALREWLNNREQAAVATVEAKQDAILHLNKDQS